jgi:hypothetical protein
MQFLFRNVWIELERKNLECKKYLFLEEIPLFYLKLFIIHQP